MPSQSEPIRVRASNWDNSIPPICKIHKITSVWHKNKSRSSGGQWACKTCSRLKSKGLRRTWKYKHNSPVEYNIKLSFTQAKYWSKKKNIKFTIEFKEIMTLIDQQKWLCAISGNKMSWLPGVKPERNRYKATVDRIDCNKGYTLDNIHIICDWANRAKSDLSMAELEKFSIGMLKLIKRRQR